MMRKTILTLSLFAVSAGAQVPTLMAGSRLRVQTAGAGRIEGTLMSQTPDTLTIAQSGAVQRKIPSGVVGRIQASQGKSHGAGAIKGGKIGAIVGGGLGLLVGLAISADGSCTGEGCDAAPITVGLVQAAAGAIWGLAIGGIVGAEKWTTVYAPGRVALTGGASQERALIGLRVRY
jgi:hypothetical protein